MDAFGVYLRGLQDSEASGGVEWFHARPKLETFEGDEVPSVDQLPDHILEALKGMV